MVDPSHPGGVLHAATTLTVYQHVHPAWGGRQPTGSRRCSTIDVDAAFEA
jgi:hypothetical protein